MNDIKMQSGTDGWGQGGAGNRPEAEEKKARSLRALSPC